MPLNKLENFIKNTEGRILYVNPNDLDSTDSITNQGNSLAQPFKTVQRALLESARFSYLRGYNNDITEKTTILLFPGEHPIDNRPGYAIYDNGGSAYAVPPSGGLGVPARQVLSLELDSVFDITDANNILYRFNSINGGVIVPRGTSIVGLDLRKTKLRPKYVPNPTDPNTDYSAIFRITGACYFWQFSIFDADASGLVYTNPSYFSDTYQSTPTFSHHKLTCFEYADGVNNVGTYGLTDLDMYYSKLSNAYNTYRNIDSKFPAEPLGFAKRAPEWEIVGAFASDPVDITNIYSGNGTTAGNRVTVTTSIEHGLNAGTPIKIRNVAEPTYNVSTVVQEVLSTTQFTYLLTSFPINLNANPSASNATVTVETDTVSGASPYIFNCSLRSVWGMNGMKADGSKASGFRSMVVAQFTAVSLQKDDRAFVKYDQSSRTYQGIPISTVWGSDLPTGSSSTDTAQVYHLDQNAIYRKGWEPSHIKITNDSFIQIVSVFAIGFNKHFDVQTGSDASITNSNSNFGQISLNAEGFKKEAFAKDNKAFITSIIPPRDINPYDTDNVEWLSLDVGITTAYGNSTTDTTRLYLYGFNAKDSLPVSLTQGYRVGAKKNDILYFSYNGVEYNAQIFMQDPSNTGTISAEKSYDVVGSPSGNIFTLNTPLNLLSTGEKIIINSEDGDLPENITEHIVYYTIKLNSTQIKIASSYTNAILGNAITVYGGSNLVIKSRVSDKNAGDLGSPIQYDSTYGNWYIKVSPNNTIYGALNTFGVGTLTETTDLAYVKRVSDGRTLDEKLYKVRVVIPKEFSNSKNPESGFVLQESSSTGARNDADFTRTTITTSDYDFKKNPRFIVKCTLDTNTVTVITELRHNLQVNDKVIIKYVTDTTNTTGDNSLGYNGTFFVSNIIDDMTFQYSIVDVNGNTHYPGTFTNNINNRTTTLPRFIRNDLQSNIFIYRNEVLSPYIQGTQDGIYHLYLLNASNPVPTEFTNLSYSQSSVNLYPELDRDNFEANPEASKSFAKRAPLGDVITNNLKRSVTRETLDKLLLKLGRALDITLVNSSSTNVYLTFDRNHGLAGIVGYNSLTPGSGHTPGTYYNVKLYNENTLSTWNGATANVVVSSGGQVNSVNIVSNGSGYSSGNNLYLDSSIIGGTANSYVTLATSGISTCIGDVVQITGSTTNSSNQYYRITSIPATNSIGLAKTSGDPTISSSQYALIIGPSIKISSTSYNSNTGLLTINSSSAHGVLNGNRFRIIDSSNNNLGDYVVEEKVSTTTFTAYVYDSKFATSVANGYILKHGLSSNDGVSDSREENLGIRGTPLYEHETLSLVSAITTDTVISVTPTSVGISSISGRFPLGTYIQLDNEIMRITTSNSESQFGVIRGSLGTRQENHDAGSLIRKIAPIAVEFRRPSILRASGHTFEYMGFGPGNYSTGLPQVQIRSLTDREEFLSQAQERSCGAVVYTGMNNKGDVYSGNTKTIASSGEIISFDIPKPSVTGQDPTKLSVVFDEVTVKERLLVEGGTSATVLSQFNGPLTVNGQLRIKAKATFSRDVKITSTTGSNSKFTGALTVNGGVGIIENLNVGGIGSFSNPQDSANVVNGSIVSLGGVGIGKNLNVGGNVGLVTTTESTSTSVGALVVTGGVGIQKQLNVDGITSLLNSTESTSTSVGALIVTGGVGIQKKLNVDGITALFNSTDSTSNSTGALVVTGGTGIGKNLYVGGNFVVATPKSTTLGGTLSVIGNTNLSGSLGVANGKATTLGGTLEVVGAATLDSTLDVTGRATVNALNINTNGMGTGDLGSSGGPDTIFGIYNTSNSGETRFNLKNSSGANNEILKLSSSFAIIQGTLTVSNATTLSSTLSVSGSTTLSSTLSVSSNASIGGSLSVTGGTTLSSTLSVGSNASIGGSLSVTGGATLSSTLSVSSSASISGTLTVGGTLNIGGTINSNGSTITLADDTVISGNLYVTQDITAFYTSDQRLKENITPIPNALDKVLSISGNIFDWTKESGKEGTEVGVIAQEVLEILPEVVTTRDNGYLAVHYDKLVPLLIEAIKELKAEIDELKGRS